MGLVRVLDAPVERVGAILERRIAAEKGWGLGPVERELGHVEAHLQVGLGRAPALCRFILTAEPGATTRLSVDVVSKSRWSPQGRCLARVDAFLDVVMQALQTSA